MLSKGPFQKSHILCLLCKECVKLERQWTKEKVAGLITNGLSGRMAVKRQKGNWVRKRLKYATLDGLQRDNTVSTASLKQRISVHFSYLFGDVHQTVITISKTSGFPNTHASEVKLYPDRKTYKHTKTPLKQRGCHIVYIKLAVTAEPLSISGTSFSKCRCLLYGSMDVTEEQ